MAVPKPKPLTHAQRVAANRAAHTSTPAQRAANQRAHGITPPGPPKPPAGYHAVNIPDPKADADYKYQSADLNHQLTQYNQQRAHGLSQYDAVYNNSLRDLGYNAATRRWNTADTTPGTYGAAQRDTSNDFTARGMGYSTPFGTAVQNMSNDYNRRVNKLTTDEGAYRTTAQDQYNQYLSSNQAQQHNALRDAVTRISSQYGVQPTQVTPGHGHSINVRNA